MGRTLVHHPLHPRHARVLEAAREVKFERDACASLGSNGLAAREAGQLVSQLVRGGESFRDLVLSTRQSGEPDPGKAAALLAAKLMSGEPKLNAWDHKVDQSIARLNCLAKWMPELELPALTEADRAVVIAEMCHGVASYKEIKDRSPWPSLRSWLGPEQTAMMDRFVPECLRLADGRIPLVLSTSGPNQRPPQITRDLAGFWLNHYPKLKQELARKYPNHECRWKPPRVVPLADKGRHVRQLQTAPPLELPAIQRRQRMIASHGCRGDQDRGVEDRSHLDFSAARFSFDDSRSASPRAASFSPNLACAPRER